MRSCGRTSENATKEELRGVRDDLRTQMMILFEDLKSTMRTLFDGVTARLDAMAARIPPVINVRRPARSG
jgi:hypothetical protein